MVTKVVYLPDLFWHRCHTENFKAAGLANQVRGGQRAGCRVTARAAPAPWDGRNLPAHPSNIMPQARTSLSQHQAAQKGHLAVMGRACQEQTPKCPWMTSGSELVVLGDDSFARLLSDQINALTVGRQLEVTRSTFT